MLCDRSLTISQSRNLSVCDICRTLRQLLLVVLQLPGLVIAYQETSLVYGSEDVREYCQMETFSPRCRHGDVIVMTTARFGRMRVGKCIDVGAQTTLHRSDPYSLGCYADVIDYADRMCSGRSECDIPVPTRELLATKPCFEQLTMYLEAGYTCMSVVEEDRSCKISVPTTVRLNLRPPISGPTSDDGDYDSDSHQSYSDALTTGARCGSASHPWILEAQTGQQINISLLDFVQLRRRRSRWSLQHREVVAMQSDTSYGYDQWLGNCAALYGYIVDKSVRPSDDYRSNSNLNTSICAGISLETGALQRDRFVYQSKGSSVEIVQTDWNPKDKDDLTYLISFEAVGCGNLVPPAQAWLSRNGNEATIGCFLTRRRWRLQCVDGQWRGIVGTCVEASGARSYASTEEFEKSLLTYQVVSVLAICLFGLVSCLGIVIAGIACIRRLQRQAYTVDFV